MNLKWQAYYVFEVERIWSGVFKDITKKCEKRLKKIMKTLSKLFVCDWD
jgi:hypothetical protein